MLEKMFTKYRLRGIDKEQNGKPVPNLRQLLERSSAIDLELVPGGPNGMVMRDGAAFMAADAPPPPSFSLVSRPSPQSIVRTLRQRPFVIGHGATTHDIPNLAILTGEVFDRLSVIDTLWLSPLAFPELDSHALRKTYIEAGGTANDPHQDAQLSIELLGRAVTSLKSMDRSWLQILRWLCSLGDTRAGYSALFDVILHEPDVADNAPLGPERILPLLHDMFDGLVCRHGLRDQLSLAYSAGDGWPLAWVLSWVHHRRLRAAPAPWLLQANPTFQAALDDLGRRRCNNAACLHCQTRNEVLGRMEHWFPPAKDSPSSFQPPFDLDGISFQQKVMEAGLARRDVFGILPTGTGKSRCFQVPALEHHARTGDLTVVISPLKALMDDQVNKAAQDGLSGISRLHGDVDRIARDQIMEDVRSGQTALLYISPERLGLPGMKQALSARRIGMWVFDEAHCLSNWGNGFRGDYRRAVSWISECGAAGSETAALMCLTATARSETQKDIQKVFKDRADRTMTVIDGGAERPNLTYRAIEREGELEVQILGLLADSKLLPLTGQAIIYAQRRKDTESLALALAKAGHRAKAYHAKLEANDKASIEQDFKSGAVRIIVATIAFGMGVDTPNVRLVIHTGPTSSLEAYAQEAGRAGRDKAPASCVLLYEPAETDRQMRALASGHLDKEDMDAVLGHILTVQGRVRDARGKQSVFPVVALPYRSIIHDILGPVNTRFDDMEAQTNRVDRIVNELETNGLIRKLPLAFSFSDLHVETRRLDQFVAQKDKLPKTERAIIDYLSEKRKTQSIEGDVFPGEPEDLADLCGLTHPDRSSHVQTALLSLRKKELLRPRVVMEIALGPRGTAEAVLAQRYTAQAAILDTIAALLAERAVEDEERAEEARQRVTHQAGATDAWSNAQPDVLDDDPQTTLARPAEPAKDRYVPLSPDRPLETTLTRISNRTNAALAEDSKLTPIEVLKHLQEIQRTGVMEVSTTPSGLTYGVSLTLSSGTDTAREVVLRRHRQETRVFATLRDRAGSGRALEIEISRLADDVEAFDMDIERCWKDPDGNAMSADAARRLCTEIIRQLAEVKVLDVASSIYPPSVQCQVEVVKRATTVIKTSYTKEMFKLGVDAFQQEEIRQLHLMDGYARAIIADPSSAPSLLRAYFHKPSKAVVKDFFTDEDLAIVLRNRPAPISRQIELRGRLDEKQAAIVHGDTDLRDMLVLAGPGAGKTRVLVERIVWLVSVERVPPEQILALCYNRRAAEEIRARLRETKALGRLGFLVSVYTYHSFALQVLGQSYAELSDSSVAEVSQASDHDLDNGKTSRSFDMILRNASARLRAHFERGGMLSDIIIRRFRWVFVDEFQDVTDDSFALIREISQQSQKKKISQAQNLEELVDVRFCAVGDDDQNIYDFGGANGEYIRAFEDLFPGSERLELTWNYRSSGAILSLSADIIAQCSDRLKINPIEIDPGRSTLPPQGIYHQQGKPALGKVSLCEASSFRIEDHAAMAAGELLRMKRLVPAKLWHWNATAVLVRNRAHIPVVERALMAAGIEISRDIQGLVPLVRVKEAIRVRDWLEQSERRSQWITAEDISGTADALDEEFPNRWGVALASRLREFAEELDDYTSIAPRHLLDEFLEWAHGWRPQQNGVTVLTAHSAKGLEFDNVAVLDAGWLGSRSRGLNDTDRRLLYVATTRARHSLSLVTSEHGAVRMMLKTTPSAHLAPSDALPLPVPAITGVATPFTPCSVRDVFLSFPAWNGPGCQQNDAKIALNLAAMSEIRTGDRLIIDRTSHGDHLPWHIYHERHDGSRQMVGKMQRRFHPGPDIHQLQAVVFAMVEWKKQDSDDRSRLSIHRDRWLTVVPEWAPSAPERDRSTVPLR